VIFNAECQSPQPSDPVAQSATDHAAATSPSPTSTEKCVAAAWLVYEDVGGPHSTSTSTTSTTSTSTKSDDDSSDRSKTDSSRHAPVQPSSPPSPDHATPGQLSGQDSAAGPRRALVKTSPPRKRESQPSVELPLSSSDHHELYVAAWDCVGDADNELTFDKGQRLIVISRKYEHLGWLVAQRTSTDGRVGLVPNNYVSKLV